MPWSEFAMTPISELHVGGDQMKYSSPRQRISLRLPNSAFKKSHKNLRAEGDGDHSAFNYPEPQAIILLSINLSRRRSFYLQFPRAAGDHSTFNYPEPQANFLLSIYLSRRRSFYVQLPRAAGDL
ncbi:MAG: hypothetical protein BWY67_01122 [Bacteroidetes bacterium ADurb.Bin397]|nr:MAG: hypothetical protein BWY67_01122 [Bacteroidetes bacterium ADurb.Bin397]